jgi:hypothetical protein
MAVLHSYRARAPDGPIGPCTRRLGYSCQAFASLHVNHVTTNLSWRIHIAAFPLGPQAIWNENGHWEVILHCRHSLGPCISFFRDRRWLFSDPDLFSGHKLSASAWWGSPHCSCLQHPSNAYRRVKKIPCSDMVSATTVWSEADSNTPPTQH